MKDLPGPRPTSCITCQRRKRKCDRARPTCVQCSESGHKCLGYGRKNPTAPRGDSLGIFRNEASGLGNQLNGLSGPGSVSHVVWTDRDQHVMSTIVSTGSNSLLSFGLDLYQFNPMAEATLNGPASDLAAAPHYYQATSIARLSPTATTGVGNSDDEHESSASGYNSEASAGAGQLVDSGLFPTLMGYSLPPRFVPKPFITGQTVSFILSEYEQLFNIMFFKPMEIHMEAVRGHFATRIIASKFVHWSSFLGAQMLFSIRQSDNHDISRFLPWLNRLDRLCITSKDDTRLDDLIGRLGGALQVAFLRYMTSDIKAGHALLRSMLPVFMQVAYADPSLWSRDPMSNGISLAHALLPPRHEVGRYIFMDNISSLTFGIPLIVDYDLSHPIIEPQGTHPIEWVHGCPNRVMFSIVRINQWRARHPGGCPMEETPWREIEADAWAWRPSCSFDPESDSGKHIVRVAVQEGWRHLLLIYLYMGMCRVTSHDPRVQSSARQISRLHSLVKSQFSGGAYLMGPILLAAICSRTEADRSAFRSSLSQPLSEKMWLTQSMKFAPILDHLWRGVGANGAAVTWEDYVASRRAVIDLGE